MITLTFPFSCVVCMCVGARTHTCPLCVWSPKVDIEKHSQPLFTALSVESLSQTYSLPAWLLLKPACSGHPSSAVPEAGPSARHHVYGFQNLGFELWLAHLCSNPLTLAHLCSFFFLQNNTAPSYLITIWRTDWVLLWFVTFWKSNYLFLASFSLFYIPLGKWNFPSGFLHADFFSSNIMG